MGSTILGLVAGNRHQALSIQFEPTATPMSTVLTAVHTAVAVLALVNPPAPSAAAPQADVAVATESAAVKPFQSELLELGFDAASRIPVNPHERDRARVQEIVATTAFRLGLKTRSAGMANQITNWRKGVVFGELAVDAARAGRAEAAETFSRYARTAVAGAQQWQSDRVLAKLAEAQVALGKVSDALESEKKFGEGEQGKVTAAIAAQEASDFDSVLAEAERAIATGNFELTSNALEICARLGERADADAARWSRIEALAAGAKGKVAREIHIRAYLRLADARIATGSPDAARALIGIAKAIRDEVRWTPDAQLPIDAEIARRIAAAGERAGALAELENGVASFIANEKLVPDVFRAVPLCAAAEVFAGIGETGRALEVYRIAVEAGALNPNARPRAEDLATTTASIARAGIEPDEAMWARLRAIRAGLVEPW